jgi:N-acetylneuraminic acid mutarotase
MISNKLLLFAFVIFTLSCSKNNSTTGSALISNAPTLLPTISGFNPAASPVDSLVTITGTNFSSDVSKDQVLFNDTLAVVKSATSTQLNVIVPAGASTGKITVAVGTGSVNSAAIFTVTDHWTLQNVFPGSFMGNALTFQIGNKVYLGMGEGAGSNNLGTWLKEFWQYDVIAKAWTQKASFPGKTGGYQVCFTAGDKGYVALNFDVSGNLSLWQYDTALNTWSQKANFPGDPEYGMVAFGINNYGYLGLGGTSPIIWQYDPAADFWTQKVNFPGTASSYPVSFVIGNYGYVGTGMNGLNTATGSQEFFQYDPSSDTWNKRADFPGVGRNMAAGFAIGNFGYLGTGFGVNGNELSDFWQYNPSSDRWIQKNDFGGGIRGQAIGFSGAGQGYLGFGIGVQHQVEPNVTSASFDDLWEYQP